MTRVYYREAVGALIVFDVTRASTFDAIPKWKDDLDAKVTLSNGKPVPTVLLANKSDLSRDGLSTQIPKLDTFCKENGFVGWFETSAKVSACEGTEGEPFIPSGFYNVFHKAVFLQSHFVSLLHNINDVQPDISLYGS